MSARVTGLNDGRSISTPLVLDIRKLLHVSMSVSVVTAYRPMQGTASVGHLATLVMSVQYTHYRTTTLQLWKYTDVSLHFTNFYRVCSKAVRQTLIVCRWTPYTSMRCLRRSNKWKKNNSNSSRETVTILQLSLTWQTSRAVLTDLSFMSMMVTWHKMAGTCR